MISGAYINSYIIKPCYIRCLMWADRLRDQARRAQRAPWLLTPLYPDCFLLVCPFFFFFLSVLFVFWCFLFFKLLTASCEERALIC